MMIFNKAEIGNAIRRKWNMLNDNGMTIRVNIMTVKYMGIDKNKTILDYDIFLTKLRTK
jgi:hypothetical protein